MALFIDGKSFAEEEMVIALGVTIHGRKVPLGFVEAATENERVCRGLIDDLIRRGLRYDQGLLVVLDGSKGLLGAVKKALKRYPGATLPMAQERKRRQLSATVTTSKDPSQASKSYDRDTYEAAKAALNALKPELRLMNASALASLEEGLEETLTLHRLGMLPGPETQLPHHELHRGTQQHGRGPHAKGQTLDELTSKT